MADWPELADLAGLAAREAFGETVQWTAEGGSPLEVRAVFSLAYEEVSPDLGVPIVSTRPNLLVRLADLPALPKEGDRFAVRSKSYAVEETRLDGDGYARLLAREASP